MNSRAFLQMRMAAGCLLLLVIQGCGSTSQVVHTDGTTMTINSGGSAKLPADFPITVYPGAGITSIAETPGTAGTPTTMAFFESKDSADKIIAYYKAELQGKSWKIDQETVSTGVAALTASTTGQQVTIGIAGSEGKSVITISVIKLDK